MTDSSEVAGQTCAVHTSAPASFVCSRCGAFACAACAVPGSTLCEKCAARIRKPRVAWRAALLAAICPGLGHVYVGRLRLGILLRLAPFLVVPCVMAVGAHHPAWLFRLLIVTVLSYLLFWPGQLVSAAVLARRSGGAYLLERYNRGWAYVVFFLAAVALSGVTSRVARGEFAEPFSIPSGAMTPTVLVGDLVYAVKVDKPADRKRGDILVFKNPARPEVTFIKRLVGLPGDHVSLSDGQVRLNGMVLPKMLVVQDFKYWRPNDGGPPSRMTADLFEEDLDGRRHAMLHATDLCAQPDLPTCTFQGGREFVVPPGEYFVMGDNREQTADSRFGFGTSVGPRLVFVPEQNIIGRAAVIWFSRSGQDGIRWDRLGRML